MTDRTNVGPGKRYVSLRVKLLIGFTLLIAVVFTALFAWLYNFATDVARTRIEQDLLSTLAAAAAGASGDRLVSLYEEAEANENGFTDDPRYWEQLEWFDEVHEIEPRAWPYTFIKAPDGEGVIWMTDLWAMDKYDPESAVGFKDSCYYPADLEDCGDIRINLYPLNLDPGNPEAYALAPPTGVRRLTAPLSAILRQGQDWEVVLDGDYYLQPLAVSVSYPVVLEADIYGDQWGSWLSAYAPITNSEGEVVAGIGIDFEADYVREVQQNVRRTVVAAFLVTYVVLFVLVWIVSNTFAQPVMQLTTAAEKIGEGQYDQDLSHLTKDRFPDEIDTLAHVFSIMVSKVYQREQKLKKRVQELEIMVDETKRDEQVSEIVDSDFFQHLAEKAQTMRRRKRSSEDEE